MIGRVAVSKGAVFTTLLIMFLITTSILPQPILADANDWADNSFECRIPIIVSNAGSKTDIVNIDYATYPNFVGNLSSDASDILFYANDNSTTIDFTPVYLNSSGPNLFLLNDSDQSMIWAYGCNNTSISSGVNYGIPIYWEPWDNMSRWTDADEGAGYSAVADGVLYQGANYAGANAVAHINSNEAHMSTTTYDTTFLLAWENTNAGGDSGDREFDAVWRDAPYTGEYVECVSQQNNAAYEMACKSSDGSGAYIDMSAGALLTNQPYFLEVSISPTIDDVDTAWYDATYTKQGSAHWDNYDADDIDRISQYRASYDATSGSQINTTSYFMVVYDNSTNSFTPGTIEYPDEGVTSSNEIAIALNNPADESINTSGDVTFAYTMTDNNASIEGCSLDANWSGSWTTNQTNSSEVNNATQSYFSVNGIPEGTYGWTVVCWNDTDYITATNRTITIDLPPQPLTVNLNTPADESSSASFTQNFTFTPEFDNISKAELFYKPSEEIKIAVFADVHYESNSDNTPPYDSWSENATARLATAISAVDSWGADVIVMLGDDVDARWGGTCDGSDAANETADLNAVNATVNISSASEIYHVMGNHEVCNLNKNSVLDIWGQNWNYTYVDTHGYRLVFLDTIDGDGPVNDYTATLGSIQRTWLSEVVSNTSIPTIVFLHVPASNISETEDYIITDRTDFQAIVEADNSSVIMVVEGHLHGEYNDSSTGIMFVNPGSFGWGATIGIGEGEPNMYLEMTVHPSNNTVHLQHINLDETHDFINFPVNTTWEWGVKQANTTEIVNNTLTGIEVTLPSDYGYINYSWNAMLTDLNSGTVFDSGNFTLVLDAGDITAPTVYIEDPNNDSYTTTSIMVNVSASETIDTWWYQHNSNGSNHTFTPNTTITGEQGQNNITVWANDSSGNEGSSTIYFYVDSVPPTFTWTISNGTETTDKTTIEWRINVSETVGSYCKFEINGTNQTGFLFDDEYPPGTAMTYCTYQETGLTSDQTRCAIAHADDTAGNVNTSSDSICRNIDITTYTCSNCEDCSNYIQNSSAGNIVYLDSNIDNDDGSCIEFEGSDGITFDCQGHTIDGDGDVGGVGIYLSNYSDASDNCTIKNCVVQEFLYNIDNVYFVGSNNLTIYNTTVRNSTNLGIWINITNSNLTSVTSWGSADSGTNIESHSSTITDCNFSYSSKYGLYLNNGELNTVENLTAIGNGLSDVYFLLEDNSTLNGSTIMNSTSYGIMIDGSLYNNITNNVIDGGYGGIFLDETGSTNSSYNYIYGNSIYNKSFKCVHYDISQSNHFYNNKLWNCSTESDIDTTYANYWNTTESSATNILGYAGYGGNYWPGYSGVDYDGNGIGDTSYTLSAGNIDYLPLIEPLFGIITAETPDSDQNWTFSSVQGGQTNVSINFSSTGNVNNTVYFTLCEDLANTSIVSVNTTTNLSLDDEEFIMLNFTINASCPDGNYEGNITWNSANSSQTGNLTFNFTVSTQTGIVDFVTSSWSASYTSGSSYSLALSVNNTGNYNLSDCNLSLTSTLGASATFSGSSFTIENGTSPQSITATISGGSTGTDETAYFKVICDSNLIGGTSQDTVTGTIQVSTASSSSSSSSSTPTCGSFTVFPDTTISGSNTEGQPIVWWVSIYNGNTSQKYTFSFEGAVSDYCEVIGALEEKTPINGLLQVKVSCIAPDDERTGHLLIRTDTNCEYSLAMIIGPGDLITNAAEGIFKAVTGVSTSEAQPIHWIYIVCLGIVIVAVIIWLLRKD